MNILILGSSGMAGHMIFNYLEGLSLYNITNLSFRQKINERTILIDVRDFHALKSEIISHKPNVIINAIGVLISGSKDSISNAVLLNSYLPHFLEDLSLEIGSKLIHISTDCVFSGNGKEAYIEDSFRDADDIYGRSKALGEVINERDLTIRTSIIGPEIKGNGEGLFHWFMNQKNRINGYSNVFWSGVTTLELAKAIHVSILNNVTGLCHLTNNTKISKYDLLLLIRAIWNRQDIEVLEVDTYLKDKSFLDTKSKIDLVVPSYRDMLLDMRQTMMKNKELYKYYIL